MENNLILILNHTVVDCIHPLITNIAEIIWFNCNIICEQGFIY